VACSSPLGGVWSFVFECVGVGIRLCLQRVVLEFVVKCLCEDVGKAIFCNGVSGGKVGEKVEVERRRERVNYKDGGRQIFTSLSRAL
jgi:hypothetical protein